MEIIDLSVLLSEDLPTTWPTEPQFQMKMSNWFRNEEVYGVPLKSAGPYQSRTLTMSDHSGTHCDAPVHFVPPENSGLAHAGPLGSKTAEQLDLRRLIGPAVVIDCRCTRDNARPKCSPMIGPRLVTDWEAQHGGIDSGTIVLFWTGWDDLYLSGAEGQKYYSTQGFLDDPGWPAPSPEALECLLERGVTCIGVDTPSVGALHDTVSAHVYGLSRDMQFVELLCNLDRLPPRGAWFAFLPLKIKGASAAPGRAIAILDMETAVSGG